MIIVLRYFWLICLVFTWVNLALWRRNARALVESGTVASADVERLFRITMPSLAVLCSSLAVVQWLAGWATPLCLYALPWTDPAAFVSWLISFMAVASLVGWVWWGEGAELLARISMVVGGRQYPPRQVRMILTVAAVLLVIGTVTMRPQLSTDGLCF